MSPSKSEWHIYRHIKSMFPQAQQGRLMCLRNRNLEIDVFIETLPLAIEYDGPHHRRRVKRDENKNYLLQQAGIPLIRVREAGLPALRSFGSIVITHDPAVPDSLEQCIQRIEDEIYKSVSSVGHRLTNRKF